MPKLPIPKFGSTVPAIVVCTLAAAAFLFAVALFLQGGFNAALAQETEQKTLTPDHYGTGDYHLRIRGEAGGLPRPVLTNTRQRITISEGHSFDPVPLPGARVDLLIRLQRPFVDPKTCIGCGVCQHECPVKGKRAIRVSAENETRNGNHALVL